LGDLLLWAMGGLFVFLMTARKMVDVPLVSLRGLPRRFAV